MAAGPVIPQQIPSTLINYTTQSTASGLFEGHVFNDGIEQPDVLGAVITKYPQFYLLSLTERIGASGDIDNDTLSWNILDNTRKSATISSVANGTTASATLTLDTSYVLADGNLGYFLVGDVVRVSESGINGIVTAVGNSGAFQTITVSRFDGANWATSTVLATWHIGHIGSAYAEGSTGAGGYRTYFPTNDWNATQVMRRDFKITRSAMKSKTWINYEGGKNWAFAQEDIEHKNFLRDVEANTVFGKRFKSSSIAGINTSRGLIEYAETLGQQVTFSSAVGVQEADWSYLLQQLSDQQGANDLIALCGTQILADTQHALGDRYREIPTSEQPRALAGLGFTSYEFLGKKVHFAKYEMFSDTSILPNVAASSTVKDFRNTALVLDFSNTEQGTNIQMKYRNGSKMIQKMIPGMASPGLEAASKFDGIEGSLLMEYMPVCFLGNRLGLVTANS